MGSAFLTGQKRKDPTGNAIETDVRVGKTFSSANGTDKTGTLVVPPASTGNATEYQVLYGYTFSNSSGVGKVGCYTPPYVPTPSIPTSITLEMLNSAFRFSSSSVTTVSLSGNDFPQIQYNDRYSGNAWSNVRMTVNY